ncbi:MAG TPA: hypothetical protein VHS53_04060 [Mucilaginibacter sp.]|jgi:hypothetical protein|nr:hypothetical protein [Mucilaginibacter sp.]
MKTKYLALAVMALIVGLSACKKEAIRHSTAPPIEADVYVAGFVGPQSQAAYWKNGSLTQLEQNSSVISYARSIAVNASGVYAAGSREGASALNAVLWFNGTSTLLSDPSVNAEAMSVVLSGSDVYVAGYQNDLAAGHTKALYWKNGAATLLSGGLVAKAIVISGSDVYIAGQTTDGVAAYWKNGTMTTLPEGNTANAITVVGSDVYVVGQSTLGSIIYWKNGTASQLLDGTVNATPAWVTGIAVSGSNVYVAGAIPNGDAGLAPTVWTNSTPKMLTVPASLSSNPSNNEATGIAVFDADVYTAGEVNNNGTQQWESFYWKNGEAPVQLHGNGNLAASYGITVVPKNN